MRFLMPLIAAILLVVSCAAPAPAPTATTRAAPTASAEPSRGVVRSLSNAIEYTLVNQSAQTTAFTGAAASIPGASTLLFYLNVTAASGTTPTLDVKIQTTEDGTNWCDIAAFAQATAASSQLVRISTIAVPSAPQVACTDGTLAAATVHQGAVGRAIRAKHGTPGGTTPSFTYVIKVWVQD